MDAKSATGKVTVAIVVDQLAAWVASERLPALPKSGGFARLMREGTWYKDVRFAHAITETAPGHASLYSGRVPREHGVVANEVLTSGRASAILLDLNTKNVSFDGVRSEPSSSASALHGDVVADQFRAQNPLSKIFSFSLKDRGAIFGGGRHPDVSLWFDATSGSFVTSTAFATNLPEWILPLASPSAIAQRTELPWTVLDPNRVARAVAGDDQSGEGNLASYGVSFPHVAGRASKPFVAYRTNPDSDRLLLELGILAIDHAPAESPILLALSLSANDYIGHIFGPDSWEAWDELQRLDSALAWFFSELDRRRGAANWTAVLSADHGVAPLPEVSRIVAQRPNPSGASESRPTASTARISSAELEKVTRDAAEKAVGRGNWIAAVVNPYLYLSMDARRLPPAKLFKLREAVTHALMKTSAVAELFDMANAPAGCPEPVDESLDALICRSVSAGRGGDYFIALKPGYFFDTEYVSGFGTSHGNAGLYDRSVPLLVRDPRSVASGKIVDAPQSFVMFSRYLESMLGIRRRP